MKRNLLIVLSAAALTTGCQSGSHSSNADSATRHDAAGVTTSATAAAPAPAAAARPPENKPAVPAIRINAGAGALKDATGVEWLSDTGFDGGDVIERPEIPIANTKQPEIYRSERYAMAGFTQKLPNGKYQVKLHFCETFEGISGAGERVFSFDVEGKPFKDFDVWAKSGGGARAYIETVPVEIADGELNIKFTAQSENPQINAIEILPAQ